ncbi:interferon-induced protein 44-like isoform X2 [Periophthalmus magnuspinnatus]|uniref:interferon-induced protein 44-like isoform X2 n=1 Tax=Periophthalmus magnuspinnatus TaxID=409849 RepID=UPI002436FEEB|nr:interferon-induced protein 44-like isoform X2 [Periophthalmus magnuspinnatus]
MLLQMKVEAPAPLLKVEAPAPLPPPTPIEFPALLPPPSPSTVFDKPWREIDWGNNAKLLKELWEYKPQNEDVRHIRVLVYGPVGAGKSSFINSITTALLGRMAIPAAVNNAQSDEGSFTVQYQTHRIRKRKRRLRDSRTHYPVVFNDIMGLESDQNVGVRAEDIKLAMMGHVKEGYKFNSMTSISPSDPYYNPHPKPDDKVHVLVLLLSANCPETDSSVIQKMKEVRQTARDLGIPQIAIGTHIDEICDEIEKDVKNVYKSKSLKTKMEMFSGEVGIPLNCIMALKNYSGAEMKNSPDMDTLILTALKHMVDFGDDFIEEMS